MKRRCASCDNFTRVLPWKPRGSQPKARSFFPRPSGISGPGPGTRFRVEETPEGVLLRPLKRFPETRLEDVLGCLNQMGKPKSVRQMDGGVAREIERRHDRGRHYRRGPFAPPP